MAEPATEKKTSSSSLMIPDWTKLPEELLECITEKLDNCFDVVHARSVCSSWRSTFPFPSRLLSARYSLPTYPIEKVGLCSLEKTPLVLFRVPVPAAKPASELFVGGISRRVESEDQTELPSPLQCSVRVKIGRSYPALMNKNTVGCQILSLGHQYRVIKWNPEGKKKTFKTVEFLPRGEGEFVVLRSRNWRLLVFTSADRKWFDLEGVGVPDDSTCTGLVTFRGRFYAMFVNKQVFVIDPDSLQATCLITLEPLSGNNYLSYLVPSGNEELFLVEKTSPTPNGKYTCRVSRLDEDGLRWVEVTDLGDRVLFVGRFLSFSCLAKEFPDGCGVSGDSILFTKNRGRTIPFFFKYGLPADAKEGVIGIAIAESPSPSCLSSELNSLKSNGIKKNMAEPATKKKTSSSSMIPDWTKLPEELLELITEKLNNCFDVVHARSVCSSWRSTFPFPCSLLSASYSLPTYPIEKVGLCSLEKIPLLLFRVPAARSASEFYVGGISRRDESEDQTELPSPLQCSVRVKIKKPDPTLMKTVGCKILSLGHQYRLINWDPEGVKTTLKTVEFLPRNKDGEGEFVVLRRCQRRLLVLTSVDRKWFDLEGVPDNTCAGLLTFRGRFYAVFVNNQVFVIDPDSLQATGLITLEPLSGNTYVSYLVPSGSDELFLVEKTSPTPNGKYTCRVSRLDEDGLRWVEVTDLGNRVLFVGSSLSFSCSAKEFTDGCGVSGDSIFFTKIEQGNKLFFFKYGLPADAKGGVVSGWNISKASCVKTLDSSILALRIKRFRP
ncbi:unnamed protein product [Microthlaspi erraticum]|uniref:F-box domain-containing protein n=1 Tax=Microthlaspi erraticum TaxID=1685480 RepID=A0A6D2IR93_9BRAS|nr:unnamed protein product [Microthlaspi erraticum]